MSGPTATFLCNGARAGAKAGAADVQLLDTYGRSRTIDLRLSDVSNRFSKAIPDALVDLLEIAAIVYVADQLVRRGAHDVESGGENWRRQLKFVIPVRAHGLWNSETTADALLDLLSFLSEDEYDFAFVKHTNPPALESYLTFSTPPTMESPSSVMLFSGGIDSLAGVVTQVIRDQESSILVTHESVNKLRGRHDKLRKAIDQHAGANKPHHITVRCHKHLKAEKEYTQRARSFLYASIAVAVAQMAGLNKIRFYENGVVSLNLPLSPQIVGSRATRTTHPMVLKAMRRFFSVITENDFKVENPFQWITKADAVRRIVDAGCGAMLAHSTSCMHTWLYSNEKPHCGTCSQCIDRRFAVLAAGADHFEQPDSYKVDLLTGERPRDERRVLLASYIETARRVAGMEIEQFYTKFGESARSFSQFDERPDSVAKKVHALYQRHGQDVVRVIEKAVATHSSSLVHRTLPEGCLLWMVSGNPAGPVLEQPSAPSRGKLTQVSDFALIAYGEHFELWFNGAKTILSRRAGVIYLHHLMQNAGRPCSLPELYVLARPDYKETGTAKAEARLDETGAELFHERVQEIDEEVEKLRTAGRGDEVARLLCEREELIAQLRENKFLNRPRLVRTDHQRLRKRVCNAITRAMDVINRYDKNAGSHFFASVSKGTVLKYQSSDPVNWRLF